MENQDIVPRGGAAADTEPAGYQFRFQVGEARVRCIVRGASLARWTRIDALGEMESLKRYARRIVKFHLRNTSERSAWLVEIGLGFVRCQADDSVTDAS